MGCSYLILILAPLALSPYRFCVRVLCRYCTVQIGTVHGSIVRSAQIQGPA